MITTSSKGHISSARFPCLRALRSDSDPSNRTIVLFAAETVGTVIQSNNSLPVGYYDEHWDSDNFDDFVGMVTLTQA